MTRNERVYLPHNRRSHKGCGFSPIEQIVLSTNIGLRRQLMQLQYITDGDVWLRLTNVPAIRCSARG